MTPYYGDESVTLWHGDCLDILPRLDVTADVLLTDPPYFQVKDDEWDRQWKQAGEFLTWLGTVVDAALPLLSPSATAWVFAGPALASRVELEVVAPRLRVLNSIRWVKEEGWHQKADIPAQRRYLTPWEGVVLAEQHQDEYADESHRLHADVFKPVGAYIRSGREHARLTRADVAQRLTGYKNIDSATANVSNWELGKNLISERDYLAVRAAVGEQHLPKPYADLRQQYDDLRAEFHRLREGEFKHLRRPFRLSKAGPVTDVWNFPTVAPYPGKHPCEKPLALLGHMIEVSSRPGDLILDPFAGSGATADAARATGRRAVLIEKDRRYCDQIASRLAQQDLFGGAA